MELGPLHNFIATLVGFAALLAYTLRLSYQLGQMSVKIDTMWSFLMRRGTVEAVRRGWGILGSPFHITPTGLDVVMPFLDKFLPQYAQWVKTGLSELEMAREFEREFGDFIMEQICIPQGVSMGACLVTIVEACRLRTGEEQQVDG